MVMIQRGQAVSLFWGKKLTSIGSDDGMSGILGWSRHWKVRHACIDWDAARDGSTVGNGYRLLVLRHLHGCTGLCTECLLMNFWKEIVVICKGRLTFLAAEVDPTLG